MVGGCVLHFLLFQVQHSQSIVVVGGGSAGVEMAAEIKTEHPEKEVGRRPWLCLRGGRLLSVLSKQNQEFAQGLGGRAPLI